VHIKDNLKVPSDETPHGWTFKSCTIGQGDVDIPACLRSIRDAGYDGYAAIEYEGPEAEDTGLRESVRYMREVMGSLG